jgi:hypothetical protein
MFEVELGQLVFGPSISQERLVPRTSVALSLVFVPQGLLNTTR